MTPNLALEPLASAQAQKHVTVNEALARLDAAAQLAVLDRDLTAPPAAPSDGDRYLLPVAPTGAWSGRGGDVAAWEAATLGWLFLTPRPGWRIWLLDEDALIVLTGAGWQAAGGGGGAASVNPVTGGLLGVNTTADAANRLAVKSDAALFSHDDVTPGTGDMRLTLNKALPAGDASLTMQSGFAARAQIGLTGDEDLHLKTSADGATFDDAMVVDNATGVVRTLRVPRIGRRMISAPAATGPMPWDTATAQGVGIAYDAATRRFTVAHAGAYLVALSLFKKSGTTPLRVLIQKNADTATPSNNAGNVYSGATGFDALGLTVMLELNAGDYVVTILESGELHGVNGDRFNFLSMCKVG